MAKKNVAIGYLGSQLDGGMGPGRWEKWRPTISLVSQPDVVVHRLELFHAPQHLALGRLLRDDMAKLSPETEVRLIEMAVEDPWDFGEVYASLYDWVRSYRFDPSREQYWAHITTGTHVAQICMFLMVEARFIPGVLLQTSPPRKWKEGEPGSMTLIDLDLSRYDRIAQRFQAERHDAVTFLKSGIATRNGRFNALIDEIERVAVRSRAPMLLAGPTGAGKSFLARRMFELKKSRHQLDGEFVEVNCATLRGDGAASTLFGHKKGSFTGAMADRAGLLRSADQGLLFLDEIGELGLDEQAMLLKAIEEKRFLPVGADREVGSDFQLIAGTNRDLRAEVAAGRFRDDLFARINLWTYSLLGLAERPEDIEPNVDHLLQLSAREAGRAVRFNAEAKARYLGFAQSPKAPWRGNFRDLSASVTRLATLAEGGRIGLPLVEAEIARLTWLWSRGGEAGAAGPATGRDVDDEGDEAEQLLLSVLDRASVDALDLFDRLQLATVLRVCRASPSLSEAGRRLFHVSRHARSVVNDADRLRKYLIKHGLTWDRIAP
ncbi:MAG: RNA repair transcriptional activator RtcR [Mitsuaria chitosanitabida]|uniref:RNA repair transcriptional activator RtcR n=1 Tax=Roseateles chitosanitabidus TaxID=65048 RepID=UPI001B03B780|nr:RNA repair transcriptional activator RtcR [Roseateles chitosanitabidus]MBO9687180.1 RNA repair transcriptional activator RtcR [Roseateles chitosanitabidus]